MVWVLRYLVVRHLGHCAGETAVLGWEVLRGERWSEVEAHWVWWCEHWVHGTSEGAGHVLHLVHPLLLAPLVLEPHLDHPHRQPGVFCQLFPHCPGWFWILVENISQCFKLLCFDCGSWSSSFAILAFFLLIIMFVIFIFF